MVMSNWTPHPIYVYRETDVYMPGSSRKLLLKEGAIAHWVLQSKGILNAQLGEFYDLPIDGIPTKVFSVKRADPIPNKLEYFIVSKLYLEAAKALGNGTTQLLTVRGRVYRYMGDTLPLGCIGFYRN